MLLGVNVPWVFANPNEAIRDLREFSRAQEFLRSGRFPEAVDALRFLADRDPDNPQFRLKLAQALERAGQSGDAESTYTTLLERHPTFYLGYRSFSRDFLERAGRPRDSRELWPRLDGLLPGYVGIQARTARAELAAGMAKEAADRMEAHAKIHPDDAESWSYLGRARRALGEQESALAAFRKALPAPSRLCARATRRRR